VLTDALLASLAAACLVTLALVPLGRRTTPFRARLVALAVLALAPLLTESPPSAPWRRLRSVSSG
jgi:hypothetical protein